jgi:hypothetical protein
MFITVRSIIRSPLWRISSFLSIFSAFGVAAQDVYLCVWRNPERTMTRIFPGANDYATENVAVTADKLAIIEKRLGHELLPGQREQFQYFRMTGAGGTAIGTIIAASQKGEFGAIEFVMGFDAAGVIKGLYVQRSRERDQTFKDRAFLDLFSGKNIAEIDKIAAAYTGKRTPGTDAVIRGLKKEIVAYSVLVGNR